MVMSPMKVLPTGCQYRSLTYNKIDMKIIKQGKKPIKRKQQKCSNCDCIFEYERSDIKSDQREGSWVVCPCCKKCISVEWF